MKTLNHRKNQTLGRLLLCGAVEIICLAAQANAATFSWDPKISGGTDLGGTGPWATGNVWWNGTSNVAWADTNDVVFGGTAGTVTLGGARTAGNVQFDTGGYTLVFGGSSLTLSSFTNTSPVAVTFTGSSTAASTVNIGTGASNLTLPGVTITELNSSNPTGLGKSGTGRLSISSANWASTGIMIVAEGQLRLTSAFSPRVRLNPGATTTTKTSVLELAGGDFSGSFGGSSGGVQITAAAADRHAGFAAIGGDRTVTMNNGTNDVSYRNGNQANQMQLLGELILATADSTGKLTLTHQNAGSGNGLRLAFNTETAGTYMRPIRVENGSAAIDAEIAMTLKDSTVKDRIGAINKTGDGVLALTYANTYTGPTMSSAGELRLNHLSAIQYSALNTSAGGTVSAGAGPGNYVFGGLISGADLATVITDDTNVTTLTLNPQSGSVTYNNVIGDLFTGMTLTKTGAGSQVLGGANTYTGGTTVSTGTLLVNNTTGSGTGSGAVTVESGGTLGGTGTVSGSVTVHGAVAPGSSTGTLSTGPATFEASRLLIGINDAATPKNGTLAVNGTLVIDGNATVLEFAVTGTPNEQTYILATYTGAVPGSFFDVFNKPSGYDLVYNHNGNSIALVKQSGGDSYTAWLTPYTAITGANRAPDVDFDGDGLDNGVEFVIGSNPETFTGPGTPGYPNLTVASPDLTYTFGRSNASKAYPVSVEVSTNLATWPTSYLVPTTDGTVGPVTVAGESVTLTLPLAPNDRRFLRLKTDIPFTP